MNTIERELEMLKACRTEEERTLLVAQLKAAHKNDNEETAFSNMRDLKSKVNDISIEIKLLEATKYGISFAYIAEKFLGKSRAYLSQRLHGNVVNGKSVKLSNEEIRKISKGLSDTGEKLRELSASLVD